jgi:glycine C-acetyltransferase
MGRVDMITITLGKALGGASGGCTFGRMEIIELLRQRSQPYPFSSALPPVIVAVAIKAIAAFTEIGKKYAVLDKRREQIIERYGH